MDDKSYKVWVNAYTNSKNSTRGDVRMDFCHIIEMHRKADKADNVEAVNLAASLWNLVEEYCIENGWLDIIPEGVVD